MARAGAEATYLPSGVRTAADLRRHYKDVRARVRGKPWAEPEVQAAPLMPEAEPVELQDTPGEKPRDWLLIEHAVPIITSADKARAILASVARRHGVNPEEVRGPRRQKELTRARHEAMYLIRRDLPRWSFPQIGRLFGGRDHTTVMHGVRQHELRMQEGVES